jgi:hypothetical protein
VRRRHGETLNAASRVYVASKKWRARWRAARAIIVFRTPPPMRFRLQPKPFLDAARRDWQFEVFAWLLRNTGGHPKFLETTLVLPTEEYFPDRGMRGHAGVAALFRRVRDHAGMADWPCSVEREGGAVAAVAPGPGRIPVFTYQREGLEPIALVAQFAREFARYLISALDEPAPGGDARRECAVEMTAVFLLAALDLGQYEIRFRQLRAVADEAGSPDSRPAARAAEG